MLSGGGSSCSEAMAAWLAEATVFGGLASDGEAASGERAAVRPALLPQRAALEQGRVGGHRGADRQRHFVGSVVYVESGLSQVTHLSPLLVIDGQQRLTTVTLLLAALANAASDSGGLQLV